MQTNSRRAADGSAKRVLTAQTPQFLLVFAWHLETGLLETALRVRGVRVRASAPAPGANHLVRNPRHEKPRIATLGKTQKRVRPLGLLGYNPVSVSSKGDVMRNRIGLFAIAAVLVAAGVWAAEKPLAVSPGSATGSLIGDACPTFSWGTVPGAQSYALVVYRLDEESEDTKLVLRLTFPGSVHGWTPALDQCLERGGQYAWSLRAVVGKGASEWSVPSLFEVASGPSAVEFEKALELVRSYIAVAAGTEDPKKAVAGGRNGFGAPTPAAVPGSRLPTRGPEPVGTTGTLTVDGEVRTVDTEGEPQLWGRGRRGADLWGQGAFDGPCNDGGSLRLSLSTLSVGWGSAPDACPVGTWVCDQEEALAGACNTSRTDTTDGSDWRDCTTAKGGNWESTGHFGWVEDRAPFNVPGISPELGTAISEDRNTTEFFVCSLLPVWCCWEV